MSVPRSTQIRYNESCSFEIREPGAFARATLARAVAELFGEPDEAWLGRLRGEAVRRELSAAAATLGLPAHLAARVFDWMPDLAGVVEERDGLLGHTVRSACPPYELEYGRGEIFQQSQSLADIAGFYAAFGYEPAGALAERPDHIVPQWEYLSVLAHKETLAAARGDESAVPVCRDAQRAFLRDHATSWMMAFFNRIRRAMPDRFFSAVADLAEALLREWCGALGVPLGPAWLELRPVSDEDSSITCGAPGESNVELGPRLAAAMGSTAWPPSGAAP